MKLSDFKKDVSLVPHTSFRVGGKTRYFFCAKSKDKLIEAVKLAKENKLPFYIISGGSNVIAPDSGFAGLVIQVHNSSFAINELKIRAEAGVLVSRLVKEAAEAGLSGLEWAAGIPGRVGGAVYGNAQAFGENIGRVVAEVEYFDARDLKIKRSIRAQCRFSEKNSLFKNNKDLIILKVLIKLKKGDRNKINQRIKEILNIRRSRQPLEYPSAGSFFVNTPPNPPSSSLIEKAGLKGARCGQAQVSEKHAGFIVNLGGATCKDVLDLARKIKSEVKRKFGITLEQEVQVIGSGKIKKHAKNFSKSY